MKYNYAELERRRLLNLAREYRKLGYDVIVEPEEGQLPDFLASFQPDMLAHNEQENVVFAVKSQKTLASSLELKDIAKAVQGEKGWRFELVVTNPREKVGIKISGEELLNRSDILSRLQEAWQLSEQEHGEAAFLLAWSSVEAVLRNFTFREGITIAPDSPELLIKNSFVHGIINKEQYAVLTEGLNSRNAIIHGYRDTAIASILNKLLLIAQQLLEDEQPAPVH